MADGDAERLRENLSTVEPRQPTESEITRFLQTYSGCVAATFCKPMAGEMLPVPSKRRAPPQLIWLLAAIRNAGKAEHMLRKMLAWRQEEGMDTILEGPAGEELNKRCKEFMTYYVDLQDKGGRPVRSSSTSGDGAVAGAGAGVWCWCWWCWWWWCGCGCGCGISWWR